MTVAALETPREYLEQIIDKVREIPEVQFVSRTTHEMIQEVKALPAVLFDYPVINNQGLSISSTAVWQPANVSLMLVTKDTDSARKQGDLYRKIITKINELAKILQFGTESQADRFSGITVGGKNVTTSIIAQELIVRKLAKPEGS